MRLPGPGLRTHRSDFREAGVGTPCWALIFAEAFRGPSRTRGNKVGFPQQSENLEIVIPNVFIAKKTITNLTHLVSK